MTNPFTILITGLPASGKTTIARQLALLLQRKKLKVKVLDGDEIRKNLSSDLGFSKEDRLEHFKRISHASKVLNQNGFIVVIAIIAPFKEMRKILREEIKNFIEIYLKCLLEICEQRDSKQNYSKARAGLISNFTGISAEFEEPEHPDLICSTVENPPDKCAELIIDKLISRKLIESSSVYAPEEEEQIKNQLKNLGYF